MTDPIKKFYTGREIFVTGGSGLMGKALLEKLLRSCKGVTRIYVLLRDLKGTAGNDRLQKIKNSRIFDRLKQEDPSSLDKLVPISGDITSFGLGISEESMKIVENVSLVFHVAATVRFDEPLANAIMLNLRGTEEALRFAMKLKHLTRFVHVSTAYSYPYMKEIDEEIYPAKADWRAMIKMAEKMDPRVIDAFTHKILGVFPNSYTFTKHLAEHIVKDYSDRLPVAIIRPSIVHCCGTEPMVGWYDKMLGVMGMIAAVHTGIVRTLYGRPSCVMDLMPLDDGVKVFILCPWWVEEKESHLICPIFNLTASQVRTYSLDTLTRISKEVSDTYPFRKLLWIPNYGLTDNIYYYYFRIYAFHVLPALILDLLVKMSGRTPFFMRLQRKSLASQIAIRFFVFTDYTFYTRRFETLVDILKQYPDYRLDHMLTNTLHDIVTISVLGSRRYLVNESDRNLPKAIKQYKIMKFVDTALSYGFWLCVGHYALNKSGMYECFA